MNTYNFAVNRPDYFVLFQLKLDVELLLMLKNWFCRLLNMKRKLSVFYYIVKLFGQILKLLADITSVETICRLFKYSL